jgi:hypothetical protein
MIVMAPPAHRYDIEILKAKADLSDDELAATVGITVRHVHRLKLTGLTHLQADRYAVACGDHPARVWPGWDGDREVLA